MKHLRITMPDGSVWRVEAETVVEHARARHRLDSDFIKTIPIMKLARHARIHQPWSSLGAVMLSPPVPVDYAEAWRQAKVEVCDADA
jgi:hypothetical protein